MRSKHLKLVREKKIEGYKYKYFDFQYKQIMRKISIEVNVGC